MRVTKGRVVAAIAGLATMGVIVALVLQRDPIRLRIHFAPAGTNEQGFPEHVHRATGLIFVELPGGTFTMGSPQSEEHRRSHEGPQHAVTLSPFLIAKYEITEADWDRVMGVSPPSASKLPKANVSFNDTAPFLERTSFKLPTEAQWEYACRGGTTGPWAGDINDTGWHYKNSGRRPHPVGNKAPNGFGLYDMAGNAWEWCRDRYRNNFYEMADATVKDPVCMVYGIGKRGIMRRGVRVTRGGSWNRKLTYARSAARYLGEQGKRIKDYGFRPVWEFR